MVRDAPSIVQWLESLGCMFVKERTVLYGQNLVKAPLEKGASCSWLPWIGDHAKSV